MTSLAIGKELWFLDNHEICSCSIASYDGQMITLTHSDISELTNKKQNNLFL